MAAVPQHARILMIAPTPFFADRGCHIRILEEAKALIALGNELVLCTYPLGRDIDGVRTERTVALPWYRKLSPGPSYHKFYVDLLLMWKVLRVCRTFKPDVIHAHLHEGIVIGKPASVLFHVPLVADLQGSLTHELLDHKFIPRAGWLIRLMQWIEKKIDQMPHHLVISSTQTARYCREVFGLSADRLSTVMDGVDLKTFSPQEIDPTLRASLQIDHDDRVVAFIGMLTEYQGIDLLLQAITEVIKQVPKVKFLIMGYPNVERYQAMARALGVDAWTRFTGKIPYEVAPRYLSMAHVATSPKISTTEANLKLLTYMAMRLPTVVFDNPVNREILGDLGIYATMGDAHALAEQLVTMLKDQDGARRLGEQSRQTAIKIYSWPAVAERLLNIYTPLMTTHH